MSPHPQRTLSLSDSGVSVEDGGMLAKQKIGSPESKHRGDVFTVRFISGTEQCSHSSRHNTANLDSLTDTLSALTATDSAFNPTLHYTANIMRAF